MLQALLILALMAVALTALLWGGSNVLQGFLYSEPAEQLYWRAPAAALGVSAFVFLWSLLAHQNPGSYNTLFNFSSTDDTQVPEFWAIKKDKREVHFRKEGGSNRYLEVGGQRKPWGRESDGITEAIVIKEKVDSEEHNATFKAELTPDGKFPSGTARYVEEDGKHRVMTEDQIGLVSTPKAGRTVANIVLNLLHFAVWFLCLWLLLRFQWPHALGLALALWLTLTLTIVPMIL